MEIKQLVKHLVAVACLVPSIASANIIYSIKETVGLGAVDGFVTTNGTVGSLESADLVDWVLTLSAPNLSPSSPLIIRKKNDSFLTPITGKFAVSASATDLFFDFSSTSGSLFLKSKIDGGTDEAYWCLGAGTTSCNGESPPAESIGFAIGRTFAQTQPMTGRVIIGSVAPPVTVPEPASLALVGFGLAGLGLTRRRKQQIT